MMLPHTGLSPLARCFPSAPCLGLCISLCWLHRQAPFPDVTAKVPTSSSGLGLCHTGNLEKAEHLSPNGCSLRTDSHLSLGRFRIPVIQLKLFVGRAASQVPGRDGQLLRFLSDELLTQTSVDQEGGKATRRYTTTETVAYGEMRHKTQLSSSSLFSSERHQLPNMGSVRGSAKCHTCLAWCMPRDGDHVDLGFKHFAEVYS